VLVSLYPSMPNMVGIFRVVYWYHPVLGSIGNASVFIMPFHVAGRSIQVLIQSDGIGKV
jgi:hypothetical protein